MVALSPGWLPQFRCTRPGPAPALDASHPQIREVVVSCEQRGGVNRPLMRTAAQVVADAGVGWRGLGRRRPATGEAAQAVAFYDAACGNRT